MFHFKGNGGGRGNTGFQIGIRCVCVDDPTAHQLTSGSNMKPHAKTHTSFKPHIRPSARRCVSEREREGRERVREKDMGAKRVKGGRTRKRNVRASGCA